MQPIIRSRQQALQVLGVGPDASEDDIRAVMRRLLQRNHPDKDGADLAVFFAVNAAKKYLTRTAVCTNCGGTGEVRTKVGRAISVSPCKQCGERK